jgi:hypothetical protein
MILRIPVEDIVLSCPIDISDYDRQSTKKKQLRDRGQQRYLINRISGRLIDGHQWRHDVC